MSDRIETLPPRKPVSKLTVWLLVIFGLNLLLGIYCRFYAGIDELELPLFCYPQIKFGLFILPYGLVIISLAALMLAKIMEILRPGMSKINIWNLAYALILAFFLILLFVYGWLLRLYALIPLALLAGWIFYRFSPSLKTVVILLWLGAVFCFFLPGNLLFLNVKLDTSQPYELKGNITGLADSKYFIVKPDSGGSKLAVKINWWGKDNDRDREAARYSLPWQPSCLGIYYTPCLPQSQGGKGQPEIEVYGVHRGLFGLKWQDKGAGHRLLLPEVHPPR